MSALEEFLRFLAKDMAFRPNAILPVSKDLARRMKSLVKGARVQLDVPIEGDVALSSEGGSSGATRR